MRDQQRVKRHQNVHQVTNGKHSVNTEVEMHDQNDQRHAGDGDFCRGKGAYVLFYQPVHQDVQFNGAMIQKDQCQEGIQAGQENDDQAGDEWPGFIPIDIAV